MSKTRVFIGVAVMAMLVAVSAVPASAWFEAKSGTSGAGSSLKSEFTVAAGVTVSCESAEGEWNIKTAGGTPTKQGTNQGIFVKVWKTCKLGTTEAIVESKAFEFGIKQPNKGETTKLSAEVIKGGTIKVASCTITVGAEGNSKLTTNSVSNSGSNLVAEANDTGITFSSAGAGCKIAAIPSKGTAASFKAPSVEGIGVKEI